jgi:hypothetical protein
MTTRSREMQELSTRPMFNAARAISFERFLANLRSQSCTLLTERDVLDLISIIQETLNQTYLEIQTRFPEGSEPQEVDLALKEFAFGNIDSINYILSRLKQRSEFPPIEFTVFTTQLFVQQKKSEALSIL